MIAFVLLLASAEPTSQPREIAERIEFIQRRLDAGTKPAAAWWYGWLIGYSALAVGQAIPAIFVTDRELRVNLLVGAGATLLGVLSVALLPLPAVWAADKLRRAPPEEKLALGEKLLKDSAESEEFGRSAVVHLAGAIVSLAQGLILWLGFNYPIDAVVNTLASLHVCEAQVWSQPTHAIRDWQEYQRVYGAGAASSTASKGPWFRFGTFPGGLAVSGGF